MEQSKIEVKWDEGGLVPAVIQDRSTGQVLMLAYMNCQALARTLETGQTHFWSRSRQELWHKGETSGNTQIVRQIRYDCDADALLIVVDPTGPACHTGEQTCFYRQLPSALPGPSQSPTETSVIATSVVPDAAEAATTNTSTAPPVGGEPRRPEANVLTELFAVIRDRKVNPPQGSYTARLFAAGPAEIAKKLGEEVIEAIVASATGDRGQLTYEAADVIYHLLVLLAYHDVSLDEVLTELERRATARVAPTETQGAALAVAPTQERRRR